MRTIGNIEVIFSIYRWRYNENEKLLWIDPLDTFDQIEVIFKTKQIERNQLKKC